MTLLLVMMIVAADLSPPIERWHPGAREHYRCGFEADSDTNFDGWPDGWTRKRAEGFPLYNRVEIRPAAAREGAHLLRVDLEGGGVAVFSPPVEIADTHSFVAGVQVRAEGVRRNEVFLSLTLLDEQRAPLETHRSEALAAVETWGMLNLGPVAPEKTGARFAQIGLHVQPVGAQSDIRATVSFDDVWLGRMPRMVLTSGRAHAIYTTKDEVEFTCTVSGVSPKDARLVFELLDADGVSVERSQRELAEAVATVPVDSQADELGAELDEFRAAPVWRPNVPGIGFYRATAALEGPAGTSCRREATFVVTVPEEAPVGGEFGWTLPRGAQSLSVDALVELLGQVGINWVKFPLWYSDTSPTHGRELVRMADGLSARGIELVGLLDRPPAEVRRKLGAAETPTANEIFSAPPEDWYPGIEPMMARLAVKVRWWQLGADTDRSFVGDAALAEKLTKVKQQLDRIAQDAHVGFGWNWLEEFPAGDDRAWKYLVLSTETPLTDAELATYLAATDQRSGERWVNITPLARDQYALATRVNDLVLRMVAAKMQGAEHIFFPDPLEPTSGLLDRDGSPRELLLPWRTTALALAGTRYRGSLDLRDGSENHVFARSGEATMVIRRERPGRETLHLANDLKYVDAQGRPLPVVADDEEGANEQTIEVGPSPSFIRGIMPELAEWQLAFRFEKGQLPSVYGMAHENAILLENCFSQHVNGSARLVPPAGWRVRPERFDVNLAPGGKLRQPLEVTLPFGATNGPQTVRADVQVRADRDYQFSVYRRIEVGLGDVTIELATRLDEGGELIVEQRVVNRTESQIGLNCHLFVPNRRRMGTQISNLGQGEDVKSYLIHDGAELVGQTLWLRAKEIGGPRTLNYRVLVEP